MNPDLLPLAHGALGLWDEIIPIAVVIILGIALAVAAIIGRRNVEEDTEDAAQIPSQDPVQVTGGSALPTETTSADHFRLD